MSRDRKDAGWSMPVLAAAAGTPQEQRAPAGPQRSGGCSEVLVTLIARVEHLTAVVERVSRHFDAGDPALRQAAASPVRAVLGDLVVDYDARQVYVAGKPVALSPTEYTVLGELARQPNKVVTTGELMRKTRGAFNPDKSYVKVYVGRLRARLQEAGGLGQCEIETVRGAGYRLSEHMHVGADRGVTSQGAA